MRKLTVKLAAVLVAAASLYYLGAAALVAGKAWLAPILIEGAWAETLKTGKSIKPWSWADTHPVMKLEVPRLGKTTLVLAGEDMRALAFGPVSLGGDTPILFGHRDTHFRFLKDLQDGDQIDLMDQGGSRTLYTVQRIWRAHKDHMFVPDQFDARGLVLVTCYPFDAIDPGTDQRYLVYASAVE